MESLKNLNEQFKSMKLLRSELLDVFNTINSNIITVNKVYLDIVKKHHNKEYLFGVDSFQFQNKMMQMEYDNMHKLFNFIDNRMYCEYYKLYKNIQEYIIHDIKYSKIIEKISHNNYPVYKDLEPFKNYDFEIIKDIYDTIINIINDLYEFLDIKTTKMTDNEEQIEMGLNIDNIVNSQHFINILLRERITMYTKYIEVINKYQTKYLKRLIVKCKLLIEIFNEDIQLKSINKNTELSPHSENNIKLVIESSNNKKQDEFLKSISDSNSSISELHLV